MTDRSKDTAKQADVAKRTDEVTLTIDGTQVTAPKGTLLIRVAEQLGIAIPRFCDHPLLPPAGPVPPRSPRGWWCALTSLPRWRARRRRGSWSSS